MSDAQPTTLLILGAGGDLTKRLLLPGLASLLHAQPGRRVTVVGADRGESSDEQWRAVVHEAFATLPEPPGDDAVTARYQQTDVEDEQSLRALIESCDAPLVVYFALPPAVSVQVVELLERITLPDPTRLALEKPFGSDEESARDLNAQLARLVPEDRIFRVDHFLGLSTVFNLVGLRFANRLLSPVWSARHLERVEIVYDEALALEGRAGYYDHAGALRDMLQSHLLQVLAIFAMEPIAAVDARELRDLTSQVLRAVHLWHDDPVTAGRRARYTAGTVDGHDVPNYVDEQGVDPANDTETLAELVLEVRNARWAGVPFVLRSGKALGTARKQILATFRPVNHLPGGLHGHNAPDRVIIDLKPAQVSIELSMNAEGSPLDLESKTLTTTLSDPEMVPYGEVLAGILDGDPLLSVRGDAAEQCWRIVSPVLDAWSHGRTPLQAYPAGSDGPDGWDAAPRS